ncbi:MAG: superoxide dismutase family protein [Acidimicrobiales bacterium]
MRRSRRISALSLLGVLALVLLAVFPGSASGDSGRSTASATLRDANGTVVGRVVFATAGDSVVVAARVDGATPGFHGFHVHAVGVCEAPFTTAGGHHNPTGADHGSHAGDMPLLLVQGDGATNAAAQTDRFTVDSLFDADGSAVIVHVASDNYANVPTRYVSTDTGVAGPDAATLATGDAGARFACGVITR